MKRLLIVMALLIAGVAESSAQQRIDALLNRDIGGVPSGYHCTKRIAVKRDPDSGEVVKRVMEVIINDNKELAKQFVEAFKLDLPTSEVCEEGQKGKVYAATAVWLNPKRVYNISVTGSLVVVNVQTIYREEESSK